MYFMVVSHLVSDSCSVNKQDDKSGPALEHLLTDESLKTSKILEGQIQCSAIVPDDYSVIMVNPFVPIFLQYSAYLLIF